MNSEISIERADVDRCKATLSVTMTVGEWRQLHDQIDGEFPGWEFRREVMGLIRLMDARFVGHEIPEEAPPSNRAEGER